MPLGQLQSQGKLQAQDLTCKAVCVSVHISGFGSWYLVRCFSRLLRAMGKGFGTAPVHGKQMEWGAQFNASHNQDHSPKCCARVGFLVVVHNFSARLGTLALWQANARAVSLMEKLALPVWFHSVALAAIRPTSDRQDRVAEVTCHLPPFTLLFVLTPELPKQFPLRQFTQ